MNIVIRFLASLGAVGITGLAILLAGSTIRARFYTHGNPYLILGVFVVITTVGSAFAGLSVIRMSSSLVAKVTVVAVTLLFWLVICYFATYYWFNRYGT